MLYMSILPQRLWLLNHRLHKQHTLPFLLFFFLTLLFVLPSVKSFATLTVSTKVVMAAHTGYVIANCSKGGNVKLAKRDTEWWNTPCNKLVLLPFNSSGKALPDQKYIFNVGVFAQRSCNFTDGKHYVGFVILNGGHGMYGLQVGCDTTGGYY